MVNNWEDVYISIIERYIDEFTLTWQKEDMNFTFGDFTMHDTVRE